MLTATTFPLRTAATWVLAALICSFLAHYDLHTDDTGVEMLFLVVAGCILALVEPRQPWRWGLLVGLTIFASEAANRIFVRPNPTLGGWWGYVLVGVVAATAGCIGAFAGAGVRRLAR